MDLFSSLIEGNKKSFPWKTDSDRRVRGCIVKLMVRQINDSVQLAEHWALYFDWTDRAATYEANDEDGYVIPSWNRGYPDVSYTWKMRRRFSVECSPCHVNSSARQLSMNGQTYLLMDRNCHHWAIALAQSIGVDIDVDCAIESCLPSDLKNVINFGYSLNELTKFTTLLDGSTRAADSGHSRVVATTGPRVASNAYTASKVSNMIRANSGQRQLSDTDSMLMASASAASSYGGRNGASASASQVAVAAANGNSRKEDTTGQTIMAIGGAALFAAVAFGTLYKNIAGDDEEKNRRDHRYNSRDSD